MTGTSTRRTDWRRIYLPDLRQRTAHPKEGHMTTLFDRNYNPNWPLAGDELAARRTDPVSSHEAARNHFGAKGLEKDILTVFSHPAYRDRWLTCDDLIRAIFGNGPYDLTTAKRLNKVQTMALKLYRRGVLYRLEPSPGTSEVLRYKLRKDI